MSETRPVFVYHASAHLATVNTAMLERCEITADDPTPGISLDESGRPDGELQEPPAMRLATEAFRTLASRMRTDEAMWNYAREARNAGATLITDLGTSQLSDPAQVERWRTAVDDENYPCRVVVALSSMMGGLSEPSELAAIGVAVGATESEKLRIGIVKIVLDGSIQGYTARISWPHYYDPPPGHPGNGLCIKSPHHVAHIVEAIHPKHGFGDGGEVPEQDEADENAKKDPKFHDVLLSME